MLEWLETELKTFTDPLTRKKVELRQYHKIGEYNTRKTINPNKQDIDLIAFTNYGSYESILKLSEKNSGVLSEYNFNMGKINNLEIAE